MDPAMYERALQATSKVVAGTRRKELENPTPCTAWTVRDLLNHLTNGCLAFAAGASGEKRPFDGEDQITDDHVDAFEKASRAAVDAFSAPAAMEKVFTMSWGDTPASVVLGLAIVDATVHGWDLAKATGQKMDIDDDIAESIHSMTTRMMEPNGSYPRGDSFAGPVTVPEDAPIADRMVAYLGRQP
ncbi:MAG: TIGR03086 family metal-binding protein [Actinomycetota bacterium]